MTEVPATYFDGRTSTPRVVTLRFLADAGVLEVIGEGVHERHPRASITIESKLGRAPRFIRIAHGGRFEVTEHAALDAALATWSKGRSDNWLHRIESNWSLVLVSVVVLAVVGWATIYFGLPWAARRIAFALPAGITRQLGEQTLAALDRAMFRPTQLTHERQLELQAKFQQFRSAVGDATDYRIEFRSAPELGANALALPNGTIVITDELVFLTKDDRELLGVLAHECGHIQHRHALRGVIQNSAVFVVLALVTGDVSSATAFGGALPAYLLQNRFSREFEREADTHAVSTMRHAAVSPEHLANVLERLAAEHGEGDSEFLAYMRSHPPTPERIQAIKGER